MHHRCSSTWCVQWRSTIFVILLLFRTCQNEYFISNLRSSSLRNRSGRKCALTKPPISSPTRGLRMTSREMPFSATLCITSLQGKKMNLRRAHPSFIERGFTYWRDATSDFKEHESSERHKEAVQVSIILRRSCPDLGEMLSFHHAQQKK